MLLTFCGRPSASRALVLSGHLTLSLTARADIPLALPFQRMADTSRGHSVTTSALDRQQTVTLANGKFFMMLGSCLNPLNLSFDKTY